MEDEILTIEEIARYLRVSERTIYDWAQRGEIPCGKIGTVWRFKRSEIEKWVNAKLSGTRKTENARGKMNAVHIILPERIVFTDSATKRDVMSILIDKLAEAPQVKDKNNLKEAMIKREGLMSTALGRKIAIPHVRIDSVTDLVMALAISKKDILDFDPLDGDPVRLVFMIAANSNQHAYYLQVLSHLMFSLKNENIAEQLLDCKTADEAYAILRTAQFSVITANNESERYDA